ncbi:MAG: hypothetical protein Q8936_10985 [Bacillota bacterium]|nr:hypothetical protein [Bacillota bacterium]
MDTIKHLFTKYYSIKLIAILILTSTLSALLKIYPLSGLVCMGLTIYVFIKSFKNIYFKKKKLITKIVIYFFMLIYLFSGFLSLGGNPDKATDSIRNQLNFDNSTTTTKN